MVEAGDSPLEPQPCPGKRSQILLLLSWTQQLLTAPPLSLGWTCSPDADPSPRCHLGNRGSDEAGSRSSSEQPPEDPTPVSKTDTLSPCRAPCQAGRDPPSADSATADSALGGRTRDRAEGSPGGLPAPSLLAGVGATGVAGPQGAQHPGKPSPGYQLQHQDAGRGGSGSEGPLGASW